MLIIGTGSIPMITAEKCVDPCNGHVSYYCFRRRGYEPRCMVFGNSDLMRMVFNLVNPRACLPLLLTAKRFYDYFLHYTDYALETNAGFLCENITLMLWARDIPQSPLHIEESACVNAGRGGNLDVLIWLLEKYEIPPKSRVYKAFINAACNAACEYGRMPLVRSLLFEYNAGWNKSLLISAAQGRQMETFEWLRTSGGPKNRNLVVDIGTLNGSALGGSVELTQHILDEYRDISINSSTFVAALKSRNDMEMLRFLLSRSAKNDINLVLPALRRTAELGRTDVMELFFEWFDYSISLQLAGLQRSAAKQQNLKMLKWFRAKEGNCPYLTHSPESFICAAKAGHVTVLDWLRDTYPNIRWSVKSCITSAVEHGHMDSVMVWIQTHASQAELNRAKNSSVVTTVIQKRSLGSILATVQWLCSQTPPYRADARSVHAACATGQLDVLQYLCSPAISPPIRRDADTFRMVMGNGLCGRLDMITWMIEQRWPGYECACDLAASNTCTVDFLQHLLAIEPKLPFDASNASVQLLTRLMNNPAGYNYGHLYPINGELLLFLLKTMPDALTGVHHKEELIADLESSKKRWTHTPAYYLGLVEIDSEEESVYSESRVVCEWCGCSDCLYSSDDADDGSEDVDEDEDNGDGSSSEDDGGIEEIFAPWGGYGRSLMMLMVLTMMNRR